MEEKMNEMEGYKNYQDKELNFINNETLKNLETHYKKFKEKMCENY